MCDTCGCNVTPGNEHLVAAGGHLAKTSSGNESVEVLKGLLDANDHQAAHNREHFERHNALAINLMSSPGAGKTALLEASIEAAKEGLRFAVIEGDLETENDADRIRARGVPAVQITTGTACHLDAHLVHDGVHHLDLDALDLVFIENVGNLVCPASFDLGQHINVALLSVTEGDDKPAKYPVMFRAADTVLISKTDLLAVLDDFAPEAAENAVRALASEAPVLQVSARAEGGLEPWLSWLEVALSRPRTDLASGRSRRPAVQPEGAVLHAAGEGGA